jgi:predicted ester cyclase
MPVDNKLLARRLYEEVWNKRDFAVVDELVGAEHLYHNPSTPNLGTGREAYRDIVKLYTGALDVQFNIEDVIAEGDRVVVRWSVRGRHNVELTGISIHRISEGKIVESWSNWDALELMRQLKAVRPPQSETTQRRHASRHH